MSDSRSPVAVGTRVLIVRSKGYPQQVHMRLTHNWSHMSADQLMESTGWTIHKLIGFERNLYSPRKMKRLAKKYAAAVGLCLLVGKVGGYDAYVIWKPKEQS